MITLEGEDANCSGCGETNSVVSFKFSGDGSVVKLCKQCQSEIHEYLSDLYWGN